MVNLWRIGVDAPTYFADDLSGEGARRVAGRWNREGSPMVYASSSIALAVLETLVHFSARDLPLNRYLVRISVDATVFAAAETLNRPPVGWDAEPPSATSMDCGERWLSKGDSLLLRVPSVIVPEEFNVLINPRHVDAKRIKAEKVRRCLYDGRLKL